MNKIYSLLLFNKAKDLMYNRILHKEYEQITHVAAATTTILYIFVNYYE